MVFMYVSQVRNEIYYYGRIRRKMLLENVVRIYVFNKVSSSELQVGQQYEVTEFLFFFFYLGQRLREIWIGLGLGLVVGSKSFRFLGFVQFGCIIFRFFGVIGLDWFLIFNVEIYFLGFYIFWGLFFVCNGWVMDLFY